MSNTGGAVIGRAYPRRQIGLISLRIFAGSHQPSYYAQMRFTLKEGHDPIAEADGLLLRALGLPSGGVARIGKTHVQLRPAEIAGSTLRIGPLALENSGLEYGASADVVRAMPTTATRVELDTTPLPGVELVTALLGRVLTVGDRVSVEVDGSVQTVKVLDVEPAGAVLIGAPTQFGATGEQDSATSKTAARTAQALLAGLDEQIDLLTGWFSLLATSNDLESAWGMPEVAGVLLEGPLGCGKVELVNEAARRAGTTVTEVDTSLVFKPDKLLDLLSAAVNDNDGPRVVFVDRLEAVIGGASMTSFRTQSLAIVRWFLDAVAKMPQVACVLGVESAGDLDPAISTSPLLPRSLAIPPPDLKRRQLLLEAAFAEVPQGELDTARLAALSSGFSGADILAAVLHASAAVAAAGSELRHRGRRGCDTRHPTVARRGSDGPGDVVWVRQGRQPR